ncbi:unnamed protein product [Brassica oleracea var. botrytis]
MRLYESGVRERANVGASKGEQRVGDLESWKSATFGFKFYDILYNYE